MVQDMTRHDKIKLIYSFMSQFVVCLNTDVIKIKDTKQLIDEHLKHKAHLHKLILLAVLVKLGSLFQSSIQLLRVRLQPMRS